MKNEQKNFNESVADAIIKNKNIGMSEETVKTSNKIDEFYSKLAPNQIADFKMIQTRFATFQTFLQIFPSFEFKKNAPGKLRLKIKFDYTGVVYDLNIAGVDILALIPELIGFIDNLPEDVKKNKLKM